MSITNKKAFHNYIITDKLEAGIVLSGEEVKSVRMGSVSLSDSFVRITDGQAFLHNAHISPYQKSREGQDPKRTRRLLLHKQEIQHLSGKLSANNLTVVPLKMYNSRNLIKVEIGLARGKKQYEKRDELKKKAIQRDIETTLREAKLRSRGGAV